VWEGWGAPHQKKNIRFCISNRRILVQTGCFLYSSPKAGFKYRSHCQNYFGNAVPRRSRWKRSLYISYVTYKTLRKWRQESGGRRLLLPILGFASFLGLILVRWTERENVMQLQRKQNCHMTKCLVRPSATH